MAITIDGKSYDESKLSDEVKSSIVQVSQQQARQKQLSAEFDNTKVLIKHHKDEITKDKEEPELIEGEDQNDSEPKNTEELEGEIADKNATPEKKSDDADK